MTVTAPITADAAVNEAISQIGVTEQPPGSNMQPYGAWYGFNGVAWCDIFMTWVLNHAGWSDVPHFAATQTHANWFRKNGSWGTPSITPPRGSLIFFDWGQGIAHVGMVEGHLADGRIATIEGNTDTAGGGSGGRVMRQNRGANIAGYGLITYLSAPAPSEEDDMPKMTLYAPEAGTDKGKLFLVGTASYEHVVDGHTETDELQRQWGQPVTINAVAWDHLKTGLRAVGS